MNKRLFFLASLFLAAVFGTATSTFAQKTKEPREPREPSSLEKIVKQANQNRVNEPKNDLFDLQADPPIESPEKQYEFGKQLLNQEPLSAPPEPIAPPELIYKQPKETPPN